MEEKVTRPACAEGFSPDAVIRLEEATKIYSLPFGDVLALDKVCLEVMPGEFIAIMGPSGSGKSTLLNLIGSLDVPTSGDIYIDGHNTRTLSDDALTELRRDRIGFIFQQFNLIPLLTVLENVEYPMILKGRESIKGNSRARDLLLKVGLTEKMLAHKPKELSGGQQQRVAIARALINDPAILLCDEPTGNLDQATGTLIMDMLLEVNKRGKTIIMVTHDADIAAYARRTITIVDGKAT
ncbi:MAG: ABC transporter ATP-binding protein [Methanogenium sp.]|jgi:putative ABC transport system ATP-binding protein